jgi:hypothetical protein
MSERGAGGGWADFAAVVFTIVGIANAVQGLSALVKKEYFAESGLVFENLQFWAIVWFVVGLAQIGAAMMLVGREPSGRILGIGLAGGSVVVTFLSMGAYTPWAFAVLAMDLLILYGLTVHSEAFSAVGAGPDWTTVAERPSVPPTIPH